MGSERNRLQLFEDRIRFNWGYHDARLERERGYQRELVEIGPQTTKQLSKEYDEAYYWGYCKGMGPRPEETSSEGAWKERGLKERNPRVYL